MPKKVKTDASTDPTPEQLKDLGQELRTESDEWREANVQTESFGVSTLEPEANLGTRLQLVREAKGITQGELAELTKQADKDGKGLSRAVISFYESNTNRPGPKEIRLLCEALRVTPSYLIYGHDDPFNQYSDAGRFHGHGRTHAEYLANMLYLFTRLDDHHKLAVARIMRDLVRPTEKGFDKRMKKEAFARFIEEARRLEEELKARGEL